LEEIIEYYGNIIKNNTRFSANASANTSIFADRFNKKKTAFQRGVKSTERCLFTQQLQQYQQIQNSLSVLSQNREYQNNRKYQSENLSPSRQYSQYSILPSNQKLLINQTKTRLYIYFAAKAEDIYSDTDNKNKTYYFSLADTKYITIVDTQFGKTVVAFYSQADQKKDFNNTYTARYIILSYLCNICQIVYPEDYYRLNNYIFDCY